MNNNYISKLTENLNPKIKHDKINIILDGGCFNGGYLYGSLLYLKNLEEKKLLTVHKISGTSVGGLIGFLYILDKLDVSEQMYELIREKFKKKGNFKCITKLLRYFQKNYLTEKFYQKCNNKLYLTYFNIKTKSQIVKKTYKNNNDLIETLIKTSYLPFLNGKNILYKQKYFDGLTPYFVKSKRGEKTIHFNLSSYDNEMFSSKQKNVYDRMLNGLIETHYFFDDNKKSKICKYVNNWDIKQTIRDYIKHKVIIPK